MRTNIAPPKRIPGWDTRRSRLLVFAFLAGVLGLATTRGRAADSEVQRPDQLKAAYLFNFMKFVEWPAGAVGDALTVCFVGGDGVHAALSADIDNKHIGARRLAARRLQGSNVTAGCHVLYVDAAAGASPQLHAGGLPMLTISDTPAFTRSGGMIELFTESNRLRFTINIDNAQKAGLRISSKLLQLAANVEKSSS